MKLSAKQLLEGIGPGVGTGGYLGDISDAEMMSINTGQGIFDPRTNMGGFGTKYSNSASFTPNKSEAGTQLDAIGAMIYTYLGGLHSDPRHALYGLKVRLNHIGLDFEFNNTIPLVEGPTAFRLLKYGKKFGTTPTTDLLRNGFDTGEDYTDIDLSFTLGKDASMRYYFDNIALHPAGKTVMATPPEKPTHKLMAAESFYAFVSQDEEFSSKVFNPVLINIVEKIEADEFDQDDVKTKLEFVIERAAKRLDVDINESQTKILVDGMFKTLFEADEHDKPEADQSRMIDLYNKLKRNHRLAEDEGEKAKIQMRMDKLRKKMKRKG
jgi:hypothetical protein